MVSRNDWWHVGTYAGVFLSPANERFHIVKRYSVSFPRSYVLRTQWHVIINSLLVKTYEKKKKKKKGITFPVVKY
jgi:hypothetical protein